MMGAFREAEAEIITEFYTAEKAVVIPNAMAQPGTANVLMRLKENLLNGASSLLNNGCPKKREF